MTRFERHTALALPATVLLYAAGCIASGPSASSPDAEDTITATDGSATMTDETEAATRSTKTVARGEAEAPLDTLLVSIHATAPRSAVDRPLELVVRARNATTEGATLLRWNTPFERTLSADVFRVTRDGEPVPYRGRMVKRALPPGEDAITRLAPGETLEHTLDLSHDYAFDVAGTYTIEFVPSPVVVEDGAGYAALVATDEDSVVIERR